MRITRTVGTSSSKSHENVHAVDLLMFAAADGAKEQQNAALVDDSACAVQDVLIEAARLQPDATMSDAFLQC